MRLSHSQHPSRRRGFPGFTLVELLLAVSLVLMLISALVFNFSSLLRGNQLEEGTVRLETLMRFARATAANSGRKVQLVFGSETNALPGTNGDVRATWEPDPLGQPGCFSDLYDAQWHVSEINDMVQVESVKLVDSVAPNVTNNAVADEESDDEGPSSGASAASRGPITFYPDGSSDSAEIIVAAKSIEEEQRMAVRLVGITGSISHRLLTADLEEGLSDAGTSGRWGNLPRERGVRDTTLDGDAPARLLGPKSDLNNSPPAYNSTSRATIGDTNRLDRLE